MANPEAGNPGIEEVDGNKKKSDAPEAPGHEAKERPVVLSRPPDSKAIADARARVLSLAGSRTEAGAHFVFDAPEGTAWGKPVELFMQNKAGEVKRAKEIFGIPVDVKTVFGRDVAFDAKTGAVTVPADLKKEDIPLLAREFVRAWKNASESNLTPPKDSPDKTLRKDYEVVAIQKEISKRRALEEGLEKLRDAYTTWRLPKTRDQYKELEEAHAATVRDAEKAIDKYMPAIAAEYVFETGQDLYKGAGGEDLFQDRLHDDMLVKQNDLVFKYDSKGKRYLFGDVADDIVALFIGFGLLTPAVWFLRGVTELADKGLTGMMKSVGQWWLGKDYKPPPSLGELREKKEEEIAKAAASQQTKK